RPARTDPGVVDENVEARLAGLDRESELPHLGKRRKIRFEEGCIFVAPSAHFGDEGFAALEVATMHEDARSCGRQTPGDDATAAVGRSGDQYCLVGEPHDSVPFEKARIRR